MKYSMFLLVVMLAGCATQNTYIQYRDAKSIPQVELLQIGQQPKIVFTDDFETAGRQLQKQKYIAIGVSSFDGDPVNTKNIIEYANRAGATVVLVRKELTYKSEQSFDYVWDVPSSLQQPLNPTPIEYDDSAHIRLQQLKSPGKRGYKQSAVYFVKSNQKLKFGVQLKDLTLSQRSKLRRNQGAVITIVFDNSPAYQADLKQGDVLIKVDGKTVENSKHASVLMQNVAVNMESSTLTIIRKNKQQDIVVWFGKQANISG